MTQQSLDVYIIALRINRIRCQSSIRDAVLFIEMYV